MVECCSKELSIARQSTQPLQLASLSKFYTRLAHPQPVQLAGKHNLYNQKTRWWKNEIKFILPTTAPMRRRSFIILILDFHQTFNIHTPKVVFFYPHPSFQVHEVSSHDRFTTTAGERIYVFMCWSLSPEQSFRFLSSADGILEYYKHLQYLPSHCKKRVPLLLQVKGHTVHCYIGNRDYFLLHHPTW